MEIYFRIRQYTHLVSWGSKKYSNLCSINPIHQVAIVVSLWHNNKKIPFDLHGLSINICSSDSKELYQYKDLMVPYIDNYNFHDSEFDSNTDIILTIRSIESLALDNILNYEFDLDYLTIQQTPAKLVPKFVLYHDFFQLGLVIGNDKSAINTAHPIDIRKCISTEQNMFWWIQDAIEDMLNEWYHDAQRTIHYNNFESDIDIE